MVFMRGNPLGYVEALAKNFDSSDSYLVGFTGSLETAQEATFQADHNRMRSIIGSQLGQDALHVSLDGVLGNQQFLSDDFICTAPRYFT